MQSFRWLADLRGTRRGRKKLRRRSAGIHAGASFHYWPALALETLENRAMLAIDLGDAPDTALGVGLRNYNTLLADNGPSHTTSPNLFLGARVDGEADAAPNVKATGDDLTTQPDDEDG